MGFIHAITTGAVTESFRNASHVTFSLGYLEQWVQSSTHSLVGLPYYGST
jgi:hypothetical protein